MEKYDVLLALTESDAYYNDPQVVGIYGKFEKRKEQLPGYHSGVFTCEGGKMFNFYSAKVKEYQFPQAAGRLSKDVACPGRDDGGYHHVVTCSGCNCSTCAMSGHAPLPVYIAWLRDQLAKGYLKNTTSYTLVEGLERGDEVWVRDEEDGVWMPVIFAGYSGSALFPYSAFSGGKAEWTAHGETECWKFCKRRNDDE